MSSAMVVPMRVRERVLGTISFVSAESGRIFDPGDLRLAEDLGLRAAAAVENARLYRARSTIAQTLQASLLPPMLPDVPGFDCGALYAPAGEDHEVGGDFYDLFATSEDHWFAVIGDVCGKGAEAAAVTALVRYTIRAAAARRRSPAAILRWVNEVDAARELDALLHGGDRAPRPLGRGGAADDGGRRPPGAAAARVDGRRRGDRRRGHAARPRRRPAAHRRHDRPPPGETVLLYTDGVTEAAAPHRVWAPEDLIAVAARGPGGSAQDLVDHIAAAARTGLTAPPRDDIAMLALRLG